MHKIRTKISHALNIDERLQEFSNTAAAFNMGHVTTSLLRLHCPSQTPSSMASCHLAHVEQLSHHLCLFNGSIKCNVKGIKSKRTFLNRSWSFQAASPCREQRRFRFSRLVIFSSLDEPSRGEESVGGNKQVQDMLADMVRLQSGKVRVTEFVDEKAQHLSNIADGANEEFSRITETAMKGMDAAGEKVLEKVDAEAQAFELELASAREEIEREEREFAEFEKNVEAARNEGLFFKSLYRSVKAAATPQSDLSKETISVLQEHQKTVSSKGRRLLFTCLAFLTGLSFMEAALATEVSWPKLLLYGALSIALLAQLVYESTRNGENKDK